jgi:hypothetical protein
MAFLSSSKVSWLLCNSYTYGLAPTISLLYSFSSKVYGYGNKTKSSCGNFNIGFTIKCEVQGPMRLRVCLGVKHTFTIGGRMQRMKPNDSQVHPHFGSYICLRVVILEFSFGSPREKWHLDVVLAKKHKVYYREGEWCLLPKAAGCVNLVFKVVLTHHFHSTCTNRLLFLVV